MYNAIHNKLHYAATSVGSITRPIYKAAVDVKDSALHLIRNPPENPGVFSTAPPYEKNMEEAPIERTDEYEKVHRFAPYSLSKKDKDIILQNGVISSQLDMRSLNTIRIFTGIEVYNLSVRLETDTSIYDTTPIRDIEEQVFINSSPEVVKKPPSITMTLTDFNEKYLKWMDGVTDTPDNIKKRKRDLKNLFKFIFNNSKINDLTTSFVKKLQRISHTFLETEDKLPCQGSPLYQDFKRSLEYRLPEAKKEMEVARTTFGEMNAYTQQKTILYDGIDDLVRLMNGGYTRGCIKYQYGNKADYDIVKDLAEQNRIMRLFIQFIKKQESSGYMESGTLQERIRDDKKYIGFSSDGKKGTFNKLYDELTGILESMRKSGEIEALKEELKEKDLAIIALESLLQISIQITHLNEGHLNLYKRYERVETKIDSEKLFEEYTKFKTLLDTLRIDPAMINLITCGEKLTELMIKYSGRKDISATENDDANAQLIILKATIDAHPVGTDQATIDTLTNVYTNVKAMIYKKYKAGLRPLEPVPAPIDLSVKDPLHKGGSLSTNTPKIDVYSLLRNGKKTPQQKLRAIFDIESNSETKTYCDTVLVLLLIDMKRKMYDFDANKFLKKIGSTLRNTKTCPVVFHMLKLILDKGMEQVVDSNAYIFSPQKPFDYIDEDTEYPIKNLEQMYAEIFDDGEKEALENMTPIRYYHRTPEEFHDLLGDSPYFLSGHSHEPEPELRGVDVDGLYDEPLRMTGDEKHLLTRGGIPMGAIIFMYITAVAKNKRSDLLKSLQSEPLLE